LSGQTPFRLTGAAGAAAAAGLGDGTADAAAATDGEAAGLAAAAGDAAGEAAGEAATAGEAAATGGVVGLGAAAGAVVGAGVGAAEVQPATRATAARTGSVELNQRERCIRRSPLQKLGDGVIPPIDGIRARSQPGGGPTDRNPRTPPARAATRVRPRRKAARI